MCMRLSFKLKRLLYLTIFLRLQPKQEINLDDLIRNKVCWTIVSSYYHKNPDKTKY